MKKEFCTRPGRAVDSARRQRGDALLEALAGTVLASVLGLGFAFTAGRMMVSQRYSATETAVLDQMITAVASSGISNVCKGTSPVTVQVGTTPLTLPTPTCTTTSLTVSGGGLTATLPSGVVTSMTLSTPSPSTAASSLLGGSGALTIWE